jgi:transposase
MDTTNEQWALIAPIIALPKKEEHRGRPRKNDRPILDGILWILRTGAPWKDLPDRYPPYQTCHRRFAEWSKREIFAEILAVLAQDMEQRGKIKLEECFIDGTFSSAKKGALLWEKRSAAREPRSWRSLTKRVFQSPSVWPLLLRTKLPWWTERLRGNLRKELRNALSAIGPMTAIR